MLERSITATRSESHPDSVALQALRRPASIASSRFRAALLRHASDTPKSTSAILRVRSRLWRIRRPRSNGEPLWRSTIAFDKRAAKSFIRINDRIRAREIRVIDENGEQLGILPPFEALRIARERGLDLVEVSPNAVPPVCRIQDYGRFLYEKEKSERAARKKQKVIVIKEVKFSVTVDEHDYQTKKNQAVRFLTEGDKVKASLRFRGRQMAHRELGYAIINRLIQDIGDAGIVEFMPRMEGTILHAILAPSKKQEAPKPKPAAASAAAAPRPPPASRSNAVTSSRPLQSKAAPAMRSGLSQSRSHVRAGRRVLISPPCMLATCVPGAVLPQLLLFRVPFCCAPLVSPWPQTSPTSHHGRPPPHKGHGRAALSPDGKQVLFTVTDSTADGAKSHLWLVRSQAAPGSRARSHFPRLPTSAANATPQWAPDGSRHLLPGPSRRTHAALPPRSARRRSRSLRPEGRARRR